MAHNFIERGRRSLPRLSLVAALALPLTGCGLDSILDVDDPDVVSPEIARDSANISGVRIGAIGDFAVAFSGQGSNSANLVSNIGLFTDEYYLSDTYNTRREVDKRDIPLENSEMTAIFRNLHRARRSAEVAADLFSKYAPTDPAYAEVTNLAGFTYVFFAENYCSGVPFSRLKEDNTLEHGKPKATAEMFDGALAHFDKAAQVATNATQQNLAKIGKARVLVDLGRFDEAAAVVQGVPTSFSYAIEHSDNTPRQENGVWFLAWQRRGYGVAHREGGNGLPFRVGSSTSPAAQDPRVPYTRTNTRAIDAPYTHFYQTKYSGRASTVVLASGVEARLIEAEAALKKGQSDAYLPILNSLRATVNLPALTDPVAPAARVDQLFQERGFWLYLTGHRLGDMRRLVRQYDRPAESVFPSGAYRRAAYARVSGTGALADENLNYITAGTYGSDVNFPVPFDEKNNPEFKQCADRNP